LFYKQLETSEKVNLVGASVGQNLKFPIIFKSAGKNKFKIKKKREFKVLNKSILVFGVTLKQITVDT